MWGIYQQFKPQYMPSGDEFFLLYFRLKMRHSKWLKSNCSVLNFELINKAYIIKGVNEGINLLMNTDETKFLSLLGFLWNG